MRTLNEIGATMSMNSHPSSRSSDGSASADFLLEFYKLHRAHEVALNNATGAYEQSALRLVLVLNAAAIAAFLALIESAGEHSLVRYDCVRAMIAIDWWAAGVACAFIATVFGYLSQRAFTVAYRFRRQAMEAVRVDDRKTLSDLFGVDKDKDSLVRDAKSQRDRAKFFQYFVYLFGFLAVSTSVVGFWIATESIHPIKPSTAALSPGKN
jgi:hypothetical protein